MYEALGSADDREDADAAGMLGLTFDQAQDKARTWFAAQLNATPGSADGLGSLYTVADAMRDYVADYERRGGRGLRTVESAINTRIKPTLGAIAVADLRTAKIRDWLHDLAASPRLVRAKSNGDRKQGKAPKDAESRRRRQAAANRVFNTLQAALNLAWRQGKAPSAEAWRRLQRFRDVDAPVVRYLSEDECRRLVNACPTDFRELVRGALLTACRYSELTALRCGDFNAESGTLAIRTSKSGKPRHVVLTEEAQAFFSEATAGRPREQEIFRRQNGDAWQPSDQRRPLAAACKKAKIVPAATFHVLRHTHGSILAMRGVPLPVIAKQLGHADTRVTERHYAHLAPNYVAETIRANFPTLGIVPPRKKVEPLRAARRRPP